MARGPDEKKKKGRFQGNWSEVRVDERSRKKQGVTWNDQSIKRGRRGPSLRLANICRINLAGKTVDPRRRSTFLFASPYIHALPVGNRFQNAGFWIGNRVSSIRVSHVRFAEKPRFKKGWDEARASDRPLCLLLSIYRPVHWVNYEFQPVNLLVEEANTCSLSLSLFRQGSSNCGRFNRGEAKLGWLFFHG